MRGSSMRRTVMSFWKYSRRVRSSARRGGEQGPGRWRQRLRLECLGGRILPTAFLSVSQGNGTDQMLTFTGGAGDSLLKITAASGVYTCHAAGDTISLDADAKRFGWTGDGTDTAQGPSALIISIRIFGRGGSTTDQLVIGDGSIQGFTSQIDVQHVDGGAWGLTVDNSKDQGRIVNLDNSSFAGFGVIGGLGPHPIY